MFAASSSTPTSGVGRRPAGQRLACCSAASDRKSTGLNSSHDQISYAVFCLKKKKNSSRSSYYENLRHKQRIMTKINVLDEEELLNMDVSFVSDWFRYKLHFVHGVDSLVDV